MIDGFGPRWVRCVIDEGTAGQFRRGNVYRTAGELGAYTYFPGKQDGFLTRRFVDCEAPAARRRRSKP